MNVGYVGRMTGDPLESGAETALKSAGCEVIFTNGSDNGGFECCRAALKQGDTLVVMRLIDIAPSLGRLADLCDEFARRQIHLRSLCGVIDTTAQSGLEAYRLIQEIRDLEHTHRSTRVQAGLAAACALGRRGGRPKALTQKDKERARQRIAAGETVVAVARSLGVGKATLYRSLRDQAA